MTPQEFKEARHQLRLSIKELANISKLYNTKLKIGDKAWL